jgi:hypothetical protein
MAPLFLVLLDRAMLYALHTGYWLGSILVGCYRIVNEYWGRDGLFSLSETCYTLPKKLWSRMGL